MLLQSKNQINLNRTNTFFMIQKKRRKYTRNELKMMIWGRNIFRTLKPVLKRAYKGSKTVKLFRKKRQEENAVKCVVILFNARILFHIS